MASASSIERSIRAGPRVERVWCRTQSGFRLVISVPGQHGPVGRTPRCGADGYAGDESPITPGTQINRVPITFGTPLSTFATLRLFRRRVAPDRGGAQGLPGSWRDALRLNLHGERQKTGSLPLSAPVLELVRQGFRGLGPSRLF